MPPRKGGVRRLAGAGLPCVSASSREKLWAEARRGRDGGVQPQIAADERRCGGATPAGAMPACTAKGVDTLSIHENRRAALGKQSCPAHTSLFCGGNPHISRFAG